VLARTSPGRPGPRVLIITPDYPPVHGGIQALMGKLAEKLPVPATRVVTLNASGAQEYDSARGVDVRRARIGAGRNRVRIAALSARAGAETLGFRPDVLLLGHVAAAPAGAVLRRGLGVPVVTYVHADEFDAWPRRCSFAMRNCDAVIAVSRHSEQMAITSGAGTDRVHRILHGVDLPVVDRDGERRAQAAPTVLTVARMTHLYKGHDVMLRAMALVREHLPDARWVVVGDGPLRSLYEQTARELGIEAAVVFTGEVDDASRDAWFRRAHVFAMPARVAPDGLGGEGFGLAYLEAAAHGLPVVAADAGGALDAVDPERTGLLIDPGDHVALAQALVSLLGNPERARAMGEAGIRWAAGFPWQATADRVADVLRTVTAANG
jgi:phosphatidylinositol alpha-1,6-mannosyltransferase